MTYTIAFTLVPFAAISAMLLASGWTQTAASFPPRRDDPASPPDHDIGDAERWLPMDGGIALESLLRHVLDRLAPVAARHFATLELAAQPGLGLAADCPALREALMRLVGDAIQASSGGRVLLAAALAGSWLEISVSDDGPVLSDTRRDAGLREVGETIAAWGAALVRLAKPGEGTRLLMRLPVAGRQEALELTRGTALVPRRGAVRPARLDAPLS